MPASEDVAASTAPDVAPEQRSGTYDASLVVRALQAYHAGATRYAARGMTGLSLQELREIEDRHELRPLLGNPNQVAITIASERQAGRPLTSRQLAHLLGMSVPQVELLQSLIRSGTRRITLITRYRISGDAFNALRASVGAYRPNNVLPKLPPSERTCGAVTHGLLLERAKNGERVADLARLAGVSDQRIRQVLAHHGFRPVRAPRVRRKKTRAVTKAVTDAQRTEVQVQMQQAHDLWQRGYRLQQIADGCGITLAALNARIQRARKILRWFAPRSRAKQSTIPIETMLERYYGGEPVRRIAADAGIDPRRVEELVAAASSQAVESQPALQARRQTPAQRRLVEQMARARDLWANHASIDEIASAYSLTLTNAHRLIERGRRKLGHEVFPPRDEPHQRDLVAASRHRWLQQLDRLWKTGASEDALCRYIGCKGANFQRRIAEYRRELGPGWLPRREQLAVTPVRSHGADSDELDHVIAMTHFFGPPPGTPIANALDRALGIAQQAAMPGRLWEPEGLLGPMITELLVSLQATTSAPSPALRMPTLPIDFTPLRTFIQEQLWTSISAAQLTHQRQPAEPGIPGLKSTGNA